jgi:hypothetical protein
MSAADEERRRVDGKERPEWHEREQERRERQPPTESA